MPDPLITLIITVLVATLGLWLFWPDKGLFWRWQQARQITRRVLIEDALKHMHHCEFHGRIPTTESLAGALNTPVNEISDLVIEMQAHDLIQFEGDRLRLTANGQNYARHVIRAHRLWERYLADQTGYAETEWHSRSERQEHTLTPEDADALSSALGHPRYDPHGDPIPTAEGELVVLPERQTLPNLALNQPAHIVHLEDEPETIYAQLVAEGLYLGMRILVTESSSRRIRFWANGDEHVLAPLLAANVFVLPIKEEEKVVAGDYESLSSLKQGESGKVVQIAAMSRGLERRRLMDLGILPGTQITAELVSPSGDPTAYRVRGALIGLRREQAEQIQISRKLEVA